MTLETVALLELVLYTKVQAPHSFFVSCKFFDGVILLSFTVMNDNNTVVKRIEKKIFRLFIVECF